MRNTNIAMLSSNKMARLVGLAFGKQLGGGGGGE